MLQSLDFIYVIAGVSFVAYLMFQLYRKGAYKTHLTFAAIVTLATVMASLVIPQITTAYNMPMFCITLVIIWLSLADTHRFWWAFAGWSLFTGFLIGVMLFGDSDYRVVVSMLYALFTGGSTLYHTGARRLAEWGGVIVAGSILALIGIMALVVVVEMGMPPEGYEILLWYETMFRATPYADVVMVVTTGFFGLSPFFYLITKGSQGPNPKI